jgi:hypothetical protein
MPISFVGAGAVVTGGTVTIPVPSGYAAGDLLLVVESSGIAITIPTGWTSFYTQAGGRALVVFGKTASASESSVVLSTGSSAGTAVMLAYRGPVYWDVRAAQTAGTTSIPTATVTTRFADEYVLSIYTVGNVGGNTWTAPAGTTTRVLTNPTAGSCALLIVDELQAVAGLTTSRTATNGPSSLTSTALTLALKEPSAFYVDPENGNDANAGTSFATALKNISGATSAKAIQPGDTVRIKEARIYNTGVNATWTSVQQRGISPYTDFANYAVFPTNTTPISLSFTYNHGYSTGDVVQFSNGTGNTAVNGIFKVTVPNSTTLTLDDSSGNGVAVGVPNVSPIFCRTIKTATPLVKPIASFAPLRTASLGTRAAWVASANVTTSLATDGNAGKGATADRVDIAAGFTTGKIAYYTLPSTLDLSAYQQLSLFINQSSGVTRGGLTISLCSDTTGDTAVETFTIPSTVALSVWTPFTINKGSALGSSIRSISISRAANNGAQFFNFNSIVACKAPTDVDALSNTSLVTKNNGTEGAYAVGGFGGSDGTVVFLDSNPTGSNLTTTGGAYYGTTETVGLWRYEPLNPYTLNSVDLPATGNATTTYTVFPSNNGVLNIPITYSGGWDSTNMSTRSGQTWFSNQNGNGQGLNNNNNINYITVDRVNYTRCNNAWVANTSSIYNTVQNCNFTATSGIGINASTLGQQRIENCIVTNTNSNGINFSFGSSIDNPTVINNCTISGSNGTNAVISANQIISNTMYTNVTNCSFNTASSTGLVSTYGTTGNITSNSFNYFNSTGFGFQQNLLGTNSNLTFVPEPAGGTSILGGAFATGYNVLPQNIYPTFSNITVNAPTTTYSQGTTNIQACISGASNFKFLNCSFTPTNVVYTGGNTLYDQGGAYLYNCTGVPSTVSQGTNYVSPYINNAAVYSQDEGNTVGNNRIYFQGGLATSQTAVRNTPSGYAWSIAPTSTSSVTSTYPLKLKLASVAANGGSAVTISAYMRRTNTGLTMQLVCPANQPYGPSTDTTASISAAADTWQQVSISFTPTQNAVFDIYVYVFGGTTFTGYVDDLGVSQ